VIAQKKEERVFSNHREKSFTKEEVRVKNPAASCEALRSKALKI